MNKSKKAVQSKEQGTSEGAKLPYKVFIEQAILKLRKKPYKGIHVVYSNFNKAFRQYYDDLDPKPIVQQLVDEGFLVCRVVKGGAVIYLSSDMEESEKNPTTASVQLWQKF